MLFMCAAGILTASIASAMTSANIVGYQGHERVVDSKGNPLFNMVGCVFTPVTNSTGAIAFSKLVTGNFNAGDEAQFLFPGGGSLVLQYYVGNLWSEDYSKWDLTGWGDNGTEADIGLFPGTAFWIKASADFTQVGQVQVAENNELTAPGITIPDDRSSGFVMMSAPYPVDYKVSQIIFRGIEAGDELQFLSADGESLILKYYVGNLWSEDYSKWDLTGWGDNGTEADYLIASGQGFWIFTDAEVTVEFPPPAGLQQL